MKYKVELLKDEVYQVRDSYYNICYQGSLANCLAWIKLEEGDYF